MMRFLRSFELKWKLMIPYVLLTMVWAATGSFLLTKSVVDRAEARVSVELQRQTQNASESFAELVATNIELVRLASFTQGVSEAAVSGDAAKAESLLQPLLVNSRADSVLLLDSNNSQILSVIRSGEPGPALDLPLRERLGKASRSAASDKAVVFSSTDQGAMVLISGSIRSGEEQSGTIIVGSAASTVVERVARSVDGEIALYDEKGSFIGGTSGAPQLSPMTVIGRMKKPSEDLVDRRAIMVSSLKGRGRVIGMIVVSRPTVSVWSEIRSTAGWIGLLGIAAILAVVWLGLMLARAITAPLKRVAETASRIADGDLDSRARIRQGDEIGTLGAAFNSMADRLQEYYVELEHRVAARTEELHRANEELERVGHAKSDFLANMSHELRTPLNAIIGYSEVLADPFFGPLKPADVRKQAKTINASGRHLLALINDVLDLSKIEAGKLILMREQVAIKKTIKEVANLVKPLADAKSLKLRMRLAKAPEVAEVDNQRFRQILLNLLSNAIKFTPDGGAVSVEAVSTDSGLQVSVTDTGIGIPDEFTSKVFEQFLQVDGSYARKQEGTGLGLALTRRLVEMHGGRVSVTSEEGKGSCFTFTIPRPTGTKKIRKAS